MRKIFEKVIYKTNKFTIEHGKLKDNFITYLHENNYSTFSFITPQNPCNKIINPDDNRKRLFDLELDIKEWDCVPCSSKHSFLDYPPEDGFLIFDIPQYEAIKLQKKYEQVAIIFGNTISCDLIF